MGKKEEAEPSASENVDGASVSQDELKLAFAAPAVFSNKIYVTVNPLGVRLTFCELREDVDFLAPRAGVYLPLSDAMALRDLLNAQLENIKLEMVQLDGNDE